MACGVRSSDLQPAGPAGKFYQVGEDIFFVRKALLARAEVIIGEILELSVDVPDDSVVEMEVNGGRRAFPRRSLTEVTRLCARLQQQCC
jgi:hypothetical protein